SLGLYYQCVGRGMRIDTASGKGDCLVLDVIDRAARRHPVVASDLFGARVAVCDGEDIREAARRQRLHWRPHPVSPRASLQADWELGEETRWEELPSLEGYAPTAGWHDQNASGKQLRVLIRFYRLEVHRVLTRGEASHLLDRCRELEVEYPTPATPAQVALLCFRGLWAPGMTKHEARRRMGQLASVKR